jgi:hypothetical protein
MNWATLSNIGDFISPIIAAIALIVTYVKTNKKALEEKINAQVDLKILEVKNEVALVTLQVGSLEKIVDVKLDNIENIATRTETLLQNHLERN